MPPNNTPDEGLPPSLDLAGTTVFVPLEMAYRDASSSTSDDRATTYQDRKPVVLPAIDWQSLEYVYQVDDNLLCAICRNPFVMPVTTYDCRHTFCRHCLHQHLDNLAELERPETCPLCRTELDGNARPPGYSRADRIVEAMVEQLQVKCPEALCDWTGPRGSVQHHVLKCGFCHVPCVDGDCDAMIMRAEQKERCLHYEVACEWCQDAIELAQQYEHRCTVCPLATVKCTMCQAPVERRGLDSHSQICATSVVACRFRELGCQHFNMGNMIGLHQQTCLYGMVAGIKEHVDAKLEKPNALERQMTRHIQNVEARMAAIEAEQAALKDALGRSNPSATGSLPEDGPATRSQDILETFDQLERRISAIAQGLETREARNSMMLLHEVMPLKEQMSEMRSQLGVLSMHVRWLMDVQRTRQRQNIFNAFAASSNSESEPASTGANDGATTPTMTSSRPPNGRTTPPRPSL